MPRVLHRHLLAYAFAVLLMLPLPAWAGAGPTYSWNGSTADWSTPANWGGTVPGSSDTAQVSSGAPDITNAVSVGTLLLSGGSLTGSGTLTIVSTGSQWTSGSMNRAGSLIIDVGSELTIGSSNEHNFDQQAIVNQGTVNWSGGQLRSGNGASITNNGTFNDQNVANNYVIAYYGGTVTFTNNGTYDKTGAGITEFSVLLDNNSLVKVEAGELRLSGGGTLASGSVVNNAATVSFNSGYTVDATTLQGTGLYQLLSGTLTLDGQLSVPSFSQTGGRLSGTQTVNSGVFTWTGGDWNATALGPVTTIASTATLNISSSNEHHFDRRAIVNEGTVNWSGGQLRSGNGASITNNGTFNDQNAASNYVSAYYGGTVTFTNNGTYEKTGEGSTYIQTDFTNAGNIHALQGQLVFQGTFANTTGSVNLSNGAVVSVPSAISFGSGSLTGSGTLIAPGGAICSGLVEPGNLSITGDLTLQSAATLSIALKGASSAGLDYGLLSISGTAALDGTLSIQFGNGFENSVATTDMFTVLTAGSTLSGSFSNVINGARLTTSDGFGSFLVYYGSGSSYGTDKLVLMDFQPVPEPSTWVLLSLGLGALCLRSRHRRRWL